MADAVTALRYLAPSRLDADGLDLQTAGGSTPAGTAANPRFFAGFLTEPEQAAQGLLAVAAVARARYFVPMTAARAAAIRDPVVTSDGAALRFESFSACCGVYARYDVLEQGLDGDLLERGTTNVDVNPPLQVALSRVGGPRAAAPGGRPRRAGGHHARTSASWSGRCRCRSGGCGASPRRRSRWPA